MFFSRKKKAQESEFHNDAADEFRRPTVLDEDPIWNQPGPRSKNEVDFSVGYVDMGSLQLPVVPGMQIQSQAIEGTDTILRVLVFLGNSGLQISVAAAPRSGGVWQEIRQQIIEAFQAEGAQATESEGRYGTELRTVVPSQMPDGGSAQSHMRIIGCEGPRWFARIDILGPAVNVPAQMAEIEKFIDRIVVVRDDKPRARLESLPVHMPREVAE
ncbi:DUF3710 domain-containing protein [Schaalia sp. lx-260]|uniref:DUF3710 domain-containing protein n=1 Tax=Schaalia sp. lx-260 TaxID=2899082 RepID=UPI001E464DCA|nr:DUF3710 domain-containing protein [Schaalia sp. lx-260]MCD4549481.1 DUF3710 domain-containing protein [Schaalia sp. lx-260]